MEQVVSYVIGLRSYPPARAALRRAGSPATEHRAYGYLAPYWTTAPYLRPAVCAFASLAALVADMGHDPGTSVGAMAADLVRRGVMREASVERKLIVAQTAPLSQLITVLRGLLVAADRAGCQVDFNDLYWILRMADHPDRARRARSRQRLLEGFYQAMAPVPTTASGHQAVSDAPGTVPSASHSAPGTTSNEAKDQT